MYLSKIYYYTQDLSLVLQEIGGRGIISILNLSMSLCSLVFWIEAVCGLVSRVGGSSFGVGLVFVPSAAGVSLMTNLVLSWWRSLNSRKWLGVPSTAGAPSTVGVVRCGFFSSVLGCSYSASAFLGRYLQRRVSMQRINSLDFVAAAATTEECGLREWRCARSSCLLWGCVWGSNGWQCPFRIWGGGWLGGKSHGEQQDCRFNLCLIPPYLRHLLDPSGLRPSSSLAGLLKHAPPSQLSTSPFGTPLKQSNNET